MNASTTQQEQQHIEMCQNTSAEYADPGTLNRGTSIQVDGARYVGTLQPISPPRPRSLPPPVDCCTPFQGT